MDTSDPRIDMADGNGNGKGSHAATDVRSGNRDASRHRRKVPAEPMPAMPTPGKSGSGDLWIDRDKLAQIESQELQQYGISVSSSTPKPKQGTSRAGSRASSRRRHRPDEHAEPGLPAAEAAAAGPAQLSQSLPNGGWFSASANGPTPGDDMAATMQLTAEPEQLSPVSTNFHGLDFGSLSNAEEVEYPNAVRSFSPHSRNASTPPAPSTSALLSTSPGTAPTSPNSLAALKGSSKIPVPSSLSRLPAPASSSSAERPSTGASRLRSNTAGGSDALTTRARTRQNSGTHRINTPGSLTSPSVSGGSQGSNSTSASPEPASDGNGTKPTSPTATAAAAAANRTSKRNSRPHSMGDVPAQLQQQLKQLSVSSTGTTGTAGTGTSTARNTADSQGPTGTGGASSARRPAHARSKRRPSNTRANHSRDYQREPVGEPPWMASSFRPDPRLPPEQQILPTHAKKLLQEQWEKEGKTGVLYDKSFAPLAVADDYMNLRLPPPDKDQNQPSDADPATTGESAQVPAATSSQVEQDSGPEGTPRLLSPEMDNPLPKPPTPVAHRPPARRSNSSYRTMPPIQRTPSATPSSRGAGSPLVQQTAISQPPAAVMAPVKSVRQPDAEKAAADSGKKEAGCGCCIIM
ncbi:hypothetical protein KEM52_006491 [Ascosphaera acerosa]|nr:hypothetical protein KEM52_006491 [Ascosphaera acerosa]